ncbi:VOC family protein [Saccharothrix sp. MB29]|nr:VOC family protein [Saccharothrix sp. MB29]
MTTVDDAKAMARRLRAGLAASGTAITHSRALELVAHQLGHRDWNTCHAALSAPAGPLLVPVLRTFPGDQAHAFYCGYLGFRVDWEHRFGDGLPLYRQVSRGGCALHLSEHHGDATPGSAVRVAVSDLTRLHAELHATRYPLRPGIEPQPWGRDMTVPGPFGNRITFHEPAGPGAPVMVIAGRG